MLPPTVPLGGVTTTLELLGGGGATELLLGATLELLGSSLELLSTLELLGATLELLGSLTELLIGGGSAWDDEEGSGF